jgi:hypothetical protein
MVKEWIDVYKDEIIQEDLNPDKILSDAKIHIFNLKNFLFKFLDKFVVE